jgi:hypothetical protein
MRGLTLETTLTHLPDRAWSHVRVAAGVRRYAR